MLRWRGRIMRLLPPVAVVLLLAYTADQLLTGERGIVTWRLLDEQVEGIRQKNEAVKADLIRLEDRVNRLKPDTNGRLDEDYVDEQIRTTLPMGKEGEDIIMLSPTQAVTP